MSRTNAHTRKHMFIPKPKLEDANEELAKEGWPNFFNIALVNPGGQVVQYGARCDQIPNDYVRIIEKRLKALTPSVPVIYRNDDWDAALEKQNVEVKPEED